MKTIVIDELDLTSPTDLHAQLKRKLNLPAYYGGNLTALNDCLQELTSPVRIVVRRRGDSLPWLYDFCRVISRCASENAFLEYVGGAIDEQAALAYEILEKIDALDGSSFPKKETRASRTGAGVTPRGTARNLATGADGDRFECDACGCRISDLLEESRFLLEGIPYCPNCGCEISNPGGSESMKWISELI